MLNPDQRFEDDGETPKTWSEDELIRQGNRLLLFVGKYLSAWVWSSVPVQGLRLGFKPGSRMRSIVKLFLRRLVSWYLYYLLHAL